jgi:hypothetical protein
MRCIVAHGDTPIGIVELPAGRPWAGGTLQPLAGFEPLRDTFAAAAAAGGEIALRILRLPAGETIDVRGLTPGLAAAVERVAALEFELRDEAGAVIATDVVRLADPGDRRGVRVHVYFRDASSGVPAVPIRKQRRGGGHAPDV